MAQLRAGRVVWATGWRVCALRTPEPGSNAQSVHRAARLHRRRAVEPLGGATWPAAAALLELALGVIDLAILQVPAARSFVSFGVPDPADAAIVLAAVTAVTDAAIVVVAVAAWAVLVGEFWRRRIVEPLRGRT